jgi:Rieske 2Fe-2S family protein
MGPFTAEELAPTRRPLLSASMLPPRAFADEDVAAWEAEHLFLGGWVCAGHAEPASQRGRFVTREIGGESLLFVGDDDGRPRGFFNVCRHRGARLVEGGEGELRGLQCGYHAWSYGFDGRLLSAPHTRELEDFDRACFGLQAVRTEQLEGLLFCDVSGRAPELAEHVGALAEHLRRYRVGELRRAARIAYAVGANWKAIVENYSECLHCPGVHPELNRLSHYLSGRDFEGAGAWCGGSMTLNEGAETMSAGAGVATRPPIAGLSEDERRHVLYFALFPNALVSLHPDYVMLHTLWPRGAARTEVVCEFYFEPDTMQRPDFDPGDAVAFWDTVNRQDWHVCELTQRGVGSRGYRPGRYTEVEHTGHAFDRMVADAYLRQEPVSRGGTLETGSRA